MQAAYINLNTREPEERHVTRRKESQRVHLFTTSMELGTERPSLLWFWGPNPRDLRTHIRLMDKILHDLKDSKLWELWYIPYVG